MTSRAPVRRISRRRFMAAALAAAPAALSAGCLPPGKRDEPTQPPRPVPNPVLRPSRRRPNGRRLPRSSPSSAICAGTSSSSITPGIRTDPWRHWDEAGRNPPIDIGSFAVPALGPYDSRDAKVIEQHARWIAEAGVGAVNISWWGQGSVEDRAVPLVMDVMRAHDIRVTFHIEPYTSSRGRAAGRRPAVSHPRVWRAPAMGHIPAARGCEAASPGRSSSCSSPTSRRREPTARGGSFPSSITPRTAYIAVRSIRCGPCCARISTRSCFPIRWSPRATPPAASTARRSTIRTSAPGVAVTGDRLFLRGALLLVPDQPRVRPLSGPAAVPGVPLPPAVRAADRGHRLGDGGAR